MTTPLSDQPPPQEPETSSLSATSGVQSEIAPGAMIWPYRIISLLGEGGFGSVYLAEQVAPVRRRVALKLIKLGMDTRQVVARFDAERQALAVMEHPNVAHVFDAGATPQGRPYFAMEYVPGIPITMFCDRERLSLRERLELFILVCEAVQHAHQKGIIHRDLKPSNVLVAMHDNKPAPKVIDFGIAKATTGSLTGASLHTLHGHVIGTPEYMSPEQASPSGYDIDTRADIYALGVILYELLSGALPFESHRLRSANPAEMYRIIHEVEPPRPSTRFRSIVSRSDERQGDSVSRSPFDADAIARRRQMDARSLLRCLRSDLDWIVMKAIEKNRARRYSSAQEFAEDVRRYLHDQPVSARPPGTAYRMRKFIRRNRRPVIAASAFALLVLASAVGATIFALREASLREYADAQALEAERRAALAEQVTQYLADDVLATLQRWPLGREQMLPELLDKAEMRIVELAGTDPVVEASVRAAYADLCLEAGFTQRALPHYRRALDGLRQLLGETHTETLEVMGGYGDALTLAGLHAEAEHMLREAVGGWSAIGQASRPTAIEAVRLLALARKKQGDLDEAISLLRDAIERSQRAGGDESWPALMAKHDIAMLFLERGEPAAAEATLAEALPRVRQVLSPLDWELSLFLAARGAALLELNRFAESYDSLTAAEDHATRLLGEEFHGVRRCRELMEQLLARWHETDSVEAKTRRRNWEQRQTSRN
ncbi:MAG TPA: serine/threonine-protein kinase [Phycisphaerales bacterium]|nr:serine/threonine-protein kinase [Phycisphaerales bacterium]HRQ76064.1 serine/threonine-protein kinase [Phycisphaerales bacterium]